MSSNKPFPSSDFDVFKENSLILDNFVNSQENEHPDRFARKRPTITGIIREAFNVRTDISTALNLCNSCRNITGFGIGHTLDADWSITTYIHRTDTNFTSGTALNRIFNHCSNLLCYALTR